MQAKVKKNLCPFIPNRMFQTCTFLSDSYAGLNLLQLIQSENSMHDEYHMKWCIKSYMPCLEKILTFTPSVSMMSPKDGISISK